MTSGDEGGRVRKPIALALPSGLGGFAQNTVPPAGALRRADGLLVRLEGNPERLGASDVADGWWIETHTLGCRNHADEPRGDWWGTHYAIHEEYASDGISAVFGDPAEGYFVTLTPQRSG